MQEHYSLIVLAILGLPVPTWVVGVGLVAAILIIVAAFFLIRGGSKKKDDVPATGNDWQQQGQAGAPGTWNQQNPAGGAWNQQSQPGANAWGAQQQQPSGGAWGNQQTPAATTANPWGNQQQATPNPWAAQQQQQQQPAANPWGSSQQQPAAANPWDNQQQQQPAANPWGVQQQQPAAANPWDNQQQQQPAANPWAAQQQPAQPAANSWGAQAPAVAPQPQEAWNQPQQAQQGWGPGGANTSSPLQAGAASGPAWGQPAQADAWGAAGAGVSQPGQFPPSINQSTPGAPSWQQQPGGFGVQGNPGPNDNDRTMLRPGGSSPAVGGGIGYVRVEEGKELGRIYEVRKEALSIGRSRESDIFLEDLAVSRLHASVVNMGNGNYALKDEGSANGTKVNGQLVNKFQTYPLQEGDRIQLGQTVLVFARR
jgi:FHA domain